MAINKVMDDLVYISSEISFKMVENIREKYLEFKAETPTKAVELSSREMEILLLIAEGFTNIQIADKIFVSKRTVETHRKSLLEKTNSKNTAMLIKSAVLQKLIK